MNRPVLGFALALLLPGAAFAQAPATTPAAPAPASPAPTTAQPVSPPPAAPAAPTGTPTSPPSTATPAPATAPPARLSDRLQGAAKANYDAGKLLFGDGDFSGALLKFGASYDASKDPGLLWNMVACEEKLRHYARAVTDIDRYIAEGGALLTDQDRIDAKSLRDTLQAFTAPITVTVSEPDADVLVDDEVVGHSPLKAPVVADIGERHVTVRKVGFKDFTTTLKVSGAATVDAQLVKEVHEGRLEVRAPDGAAIKIDGNPVALGTWSGTLASGGHTLNVSAPGMRLYQTEVVLQDAQTRTVDVSLEPESKTGGVPWWAWVGGGAIVVAGASVGGYFLLHKSDTYAPTTSGTIQPGTVQLPLLK
jgi:hypothetical protein